MMTKIQILTYLSCQEALVSVLSCSHDWWLIVIKTAHCLKFCDLLGIGTFAIVLMMYTAAHNAD